MTQAAWRPGRDQPAEADRLDQSEYLVALLDEPADTYRRLYRQRSMGANYAIRYQLAFTGYALAAAAWADPAGRDRWLAGLGRCIDRLLERPVWDYWITRTGSPDPVHLDNVMYSGHLAHLIGLYAKLSADRRYDDGFDLVWDASTRFRYTHTSLVGRLQAQMIANDYHGIACEPGMVFFSCNTHAALALVLHDQVHGTRFAEAVDDWLTWSDRVLLLGPRAVWPPGPRRSPSPCSTPGACCSCRRSIPTVLGRPTPGSGGSSSPDARAGSVWRPLR